MNAQMDVNEITLLSREYHDLISNQHHKDHDCHWTIEMQWSYGEGPEYTVQHYGYLYDFPEEGIVCASYDLARRELIKQLRKAITAEKWRQIRVEGVAVERFPDLQQTTEIHARALLDQLETWTGWKPVGCTDIHGYRAEDGFEEWWLAISIEGKERGERDTVTFDEPSFSSAEEARAVAAALTRIVQEGEAYGI